MNKRILCAITFSVFNFIFFSSAQAGEMGEKPMTVVQPYFGVEANYTWTNIKAPTLNLVAGTRNHKPWGGRLSAGLLHFYTDRLGLTGEVGGGYYSSTTVKALHVSSLGKFVISGYDVLVGTLYRNEYLDLFAKIGFMAEDVRIDFTRYNLSQVFNGNLINGETRSRTSKTDALAQIRVGGIYNLHDNLGVTLTYLHVFGSTMRYDSNSVSSVTGGLQRNLNVDMQNPTLDTILLGVRYYIV